ncbi:hypothetical protein [Arthrobacter sp. CAN_A1]|uniref:hypothetical protein n=1 Tax=Arthrobacter sp. CAN_A1 TaxID=2787717 RepID=UPI0018C98E3E
MQTTGTRRLVAGSAALAATLLILSTTVFDVINRTALEASIFLLATGAALLSGGLFLLISGLRARSRDLNTVRTYDSLGYDSPGFDPRRGTTYGGSSVSTPDMAPVRCAGDLGSL